MGEIFLNNLYNRSNQLSGFTSPMQIVTKTTKWTCPETGVYYISCIGQGGHNAAYASNSVYTLATGGGGGISESKLSLKEGEKVQITIDSGVSSFGNFLSSTSGRNANITSSGDVSLGQGGSGAGGNVGNFDGDKGIKKGNIKNTYYLQGGGTNSSAKYGGAKGGIVMVAFKPGYSLGDGAFLSPCPDPANLGIYPYGSSQGVSYASNFDYTGQPYFMKNGAVIIELLK